MNPIRKIAIIGATGMLGIPVTVALLDAGFAVTALSRKPDEARRVLPAATQIVAADARDEGSLRRGLAGQDALYLNLSIAPTERRGDFHTEQQGLEHILVGGAFRRHQAHRLRLGDDPRQPQPLVGARRLAQRDRAH